MCYDRPINRPLGIKPLRAIIAFADPIADPIGSWENNIKAPVSLGWRLQVTLDPTVHGCAFLWKTEHGPQWFRALLTSGQAYPRRRVCWWGCWRSSALAGWPWRGLCVWLQWSGGHTSSPLLFYRQHIGYSWTENEKRQKKGVKIKSIRPRGASITLRTVTASVNTLECIKTLVDNWEMYFCSPSGVY